MERIQQFFENFPEHFNYFMENYLFKILICIAVIFIALLLKFVFSGIVRRVTRKYTEKKGKEAEYAKRLAEIFLPAIRLLLITAAFYICSLILFDGGVAAEFCAKLTKSLVMASVFVLLSKLSDFWVFLYIKSMERKGLSAHNLGVKYLGTILKACVYIFGILAVLQQWVSNITSLLAGLSIGGVAFALAAQDTAANIFGAITVVFDRPFEIGDFIEVNGISGTVVSMGIRSTRIQRVDQSIAFIPNSKMSSENIVNWNMLKNRRIDTTLGVTYDTPTRTLKAFTNALRQSLEANENVVSDSIMVWFSDFEEFSLTVNIKYLVNTASLFDANMIREDINLEIMELAEALGVEFAFPTNTVYLKSENIPPQEK